MHFSKWKFRALWRTKSIFSTHMAEIVLLSDVILTHMARSIRKKSEQHILEVSVTLQMSDSYNLENVLKKVFLSPLVLYKYQKTQSSL